ncbi:MAG: LysR family transcriptional regulator [Geminicoccaceae bacterium]|nr:MAG: LysR family transcriptional regulator [Geminicoccaceae bacterium]
MAPSMMPRLDLDQIRAFQRIAQLGTCHAVARDLGLTQPSVSHRMRELDAALQVQPCCARSCPPGPRQERRDY